MVGPASPDEPLQIVVALKLRNRPELDALVAGIIDFRSPNFRRYIPHDQLFARYAPGADQLQRVTAHLRMAGFADIRVASGGLLVSARGTAATIARAFNTTLAEFERDGVRALANTSDVQVPVELSDSIEAVLGLQRLDQSHLSASTVLPTQFPALYAASSLPTASNTTVAMMAAGSLAAEQNTLADLKTFETQQSLQAIAPSVVLASQYGPAGNSTLDAAETEEWDIDSQSILGMAGGQLGGLILYWSQDLFDASLTQAFAAAVHANAARVINISFGGCEQSAGKDGALQADDQLFELAVAQGQTFVAASGDNGAYPCGTFTAPSPYGSSQGVQYPASSPYVIAVGGTNLSLTSTGTYSSETGWSLSGGGPSAIESQPSWQAGVVPGTTRGVPDIALDAAGTESTILVGNVAHHVGGTSLAAPLFVGAWARLESAHSNGLGFPAAWIYGLGTSQLASMFNDITSGANGPVVGGVQEGYGAAPGWDYVTGFGSPNFAAWNTYLNSGLLAANVSSAAGRLLLYYRGQDMNLYEGQWPWPSQPRQLTQVPGASPAAPAVAPGSSIVAYDNSIYHAPEVFYLAATAYGDHVEQLWGTSDYPTDLNDQIAPQSPVEPALAGSSLVGFMDSCAATDNVFYIDTNHHVRLLTWSPDSGWTSQDLTALTHSGNAAGTQLIGHIKGAGAEVFYLESDNRVHELWRWSGCPNAAQFDGWHTTTVNLANLNNAPNAAAGSPLAGFYDANAAADAIFYVDVQGYLRELYFSPQGIWENINVTLTSGAAKPAAGSALSAHLNLGSGSREAVYYLDSANNVRVVTASSQSATQWTNAGATVGINLLAGTCTGTLAGAPAAAAVSPLVSDTIGSTDEIYYVSSAGLIYDLESSGNGLRCSLAIQGARAAP
jgi:hypothetical protein